MTENTYKCGACGTTFKTLQALSKHTRWSLRDQLGGAALLPPRAAVDSLSRLPKTVKR